MSDQADVVWHKINIIQTKPFLKLISNSFYVNNKIKLHFNVWEAAKFVILCTRSINAWLINLYSEIHE